MTATRTPILPGDIKKGDTIRCEYDLGSTDYNSSATEYTAPEDGFKYSHRPSTHYLLHRPVPPVVLPTEPGIYTDNVGDLWKINEFGLYCIGGAPSSADNYAPFTRLRPEAEVVAEAMGRLAGYDWSNTGMAADRANVAASYGVTL